MGMSRLDWTIVARVIAGIFECPTCSMHKDDLQPPWIGLKYEPGGLVLLAQNPADKSMPTAIYQQLRQLKAQPNTRTLRAWSKARSTHMVSKPWPQWDLAFGPALGETFRPERLAWLNVVSYVTKKNSTPGKVELRHGRDQHLGPLLALLAPSRIVTRYNTARSAVIAMPGSPPWKQDVDRLCIRDLPDRSHRPNPDDIEMVRSTLDGLVTAGVLTP
jgi:hypothetical protein